jgi:hypothetical protein
MTLRISARVESATVILVLRLHDYLGTSVDCIAKMSINIFDNYVRTLRANPADRSWSFLKLVEWAISGRADHNHAAAQSELSMFDNPGLTVDY